ncbi:thiamine phosphate synthase [Shimia ponticola]|uniref:thiamine phosphate synthase n=1 Tax=Shimia ponticola TaxID=2582893 RepID=UPI0011BE8D37|nr:thiamine phosphate synthase [Shimia ponticola]
MAEIEHPQIYLITPPDFELSQFPGQLAQCLDATDVACVRLALATSDEDRLMRAADAVREVCYSRDVPLVIDTHVQLVERLGLDGVHLNDGARSIRSVRKEFGPDPIVGCHCQASRHDGMSAGEHGADYVSFGPVTASALGDGTVAPADLFEWWSQMIEVPVVAEGGLTTDMVHKLAPHVDFFGLGPEVWNSDTPAQQLVELVQVSQG